MKLIIISIETNYDLFEKSSGLANIIKKHLFLTKTHTIQIGKAAKKLYLSAIKRGGGAKGLPIRKRRSFFFY